MRIRAASGTKAKACDNSLCTWSSCLRTICSWASFSALSIARRLSSLVNSSSWPPPACLLNSSCRRARSILARAACSSRPLASCATDTRPAVADCSTVDARTDAAQLLEFLRHASLRQLLAGCMSDRRQSALCRALRRASMPAKSNSRALDPAYQLTPLPAQVHGVRVRPRRCPAASLGLAQGRGRADDDGIVLDSPHRLGLAW